MSKKKVIIGMSGGVDSAVAGYLLKEQGYEVIGLFMRNWKENQGGLCNADEDFRDVRKVCDNLSIPYYSIDFSEEYMNRVFKLFVEEYKQGRTPNPDVLCNSEIKFDAFAKYAFNAGADYIATGHYAGIEHIADKNYLLRARDENKDQTYFLNQVTNRQLDNVLFPLGRLMKSEVREIAKQKGISVAKKKDSTGICFIGERKFREFLSHYIPMKSGNTIDTATGNIVGTHNGVYYYTKGQRRGLGIGGIQTGSGDRWFVQDKDVHNNVLYVSQGETDVLFSKGLEMTEMNFIPDKMDNKDFECYARIRHRQPFQKARLQSTSNGYKLIFEEKQRAIVCGQYAVIYNEKYCLGGGSITSVIDNL